MKLQEFVDNWESIKKDIIKRMPKCGDCKAIVDSNEYHVGKKLVCSDCYFDAFGEEIEKHPIGIPRMHRSR